MSRKAIALVGGLNLSPNRFDVAEGQMIECYNFEVSKDGVVTSIAGDRRYSGGCLFGATVGFRSSSTATDLQHWGLGPITTIGGDTFAYSGVCIPTMYFSNSGVTIVGGAVGRLPLTGERINGAVDQLDDYATAAVAAIANSMLHAHRIMTWENARNWGGVGDYDDTGAGTFGTTLAAEPLYCTSQIGYPPGCFYWKDRLHVVCDIAAYEFREGAVEPALGASVYLYQATDEDGPYTVERVIVESGSWGNGDATGTIWLIANTFENVVIRVYDEGGSTDAELRSAAGGGGTLYLTLRSQLDPQAALLSVETGPFAYATSTLSPTVPWERVDLGYEIRFSGGDNAFVVVNRLALDDRLTSPSATALTLPATGDSSYWSNPSRLSLDDGSTSTVSSGTLNITSPITATEFGFSIPSYSTITGITVEIERQKSGGGTKTITDKVIELIGGSRASGNRASATIWPGTLTVATYGGATDLWDLELSPEQVNSDTFGVRITVQESVAGSNTATAEIDCVKVRIHYKPYESLVYFYDTVAAADVSTGNVVWYYKEKGDWTTNDAEGVATVYNLSSASSIKSGLRIMSGAGNTGTFYGLTAGAADKVYLPSSAQCQAESSQYEFEIGNFYGSTKFEQVFGVNGAGPAFSYDGKYAIRIRTGVENNLEKPRHVAKHGYQLALGYAHGDVVFSDVGAPESFAAVTGGSSPVSEDPDFDGGATNEPLADPVYALVSIAEQSLAVFCRNSVNRISGSAGTFTTQVVRADSGVVEYTVKDLGGLLLYTDFRGIGILQPSDIFGQLLPRYVSSTVSPWLTPRLQQSGNSYVTLTGPIRAETFKSKNQYRLFFRDRYVLTMTLVGQDFVPQFSLQQWARDARATCTGVHSTGADLSFYTTSGELLASWGSAYAYQADVGTTFDGVHIPKRALFFLGPMDSWDREKRYERVDLHLGAFGYANLGARAFIDHARSGGFQAASCIAAVAGQLDTATAADLEYPQNFKSSVSVNARGFALSLHIEQFGGGDGWDYTAGATLTDHKYLMPITLNEATVYFEPEATLRAGR